MVTATVRSLTVVTYEAKKIKLSPQDRTVSFQFKKKATWIRKSVPLIQVEYIDMAQGIVAVKQIDDLCSFEGVPTKDGIDNFVALNVGGGDKVYINASSIVMEEKVKSKK